MGISPGNLYYHFHGKEPLILGLFERFQNELAPLLDPPSDVNWRRRTTGCSCT
jgi:AcrR family transcriptional regulator